MSIYRILGVTHNIMHAWSTTRVPSAYGDNADPVENGARFPKISIDRCDGLTPVTTTTVTAALSFRPVFSTTVYTRVANNIITCFVSCDSFGRREEYLKKHTRPTPAWWRLPRRSQSVLHGAFIYREFLFYSEFIQVLWYAWRNTNPYGCVSTYGKNSTNNRWDTVPFTHYTYRTVRITPRIIQYLGKVTPS